MTPRQVLFYYLWTAPRVLQVIILIFLGRRQLYRKFPIFTAYTAFSIFRFTLLFLISKSPAYRTYFEWYSFTLGISIALTFGIVSEIVAHVFSDQIALRDLRKPLFRWTTVAFLMIAFSFATYTHRSDIDPTWFAVHVLERSANIVLCGLTIGLFLFSYYLRLLWSRLVFGIALGVGILCSLELATTALRSQIGYSAHLALDLFAMATYNCAVLIWLYYLVSPERKPVYADPKLPQHDLELWSDEIERLLIR